MARRAVEFTATTPEAGLYLADLEREDQVLAAQLAQLGQMTPGQRAGLKRALSGALVKTRALLRSLRAQYKGLLRELAARCREKVKAVREQKKELRARFKAEFAQLIASEKALAVQCNLDKSRIVEDHSKALAWLDKRRGELSTARGKIEQIDGTADRRLKAYLKRRERESESDDAVRYDLEKNFPEALPWFDQNKAKFKKPPKGKKLSRLEMILQYLQENPEKVQEARIKSAEAEIKAHEKRERDLGKKYERLQTQRTARRGAAVRRAGQRSAGVAFGRKLDKARAKERAGLEEAPF